MRGLVCYFFMKYIPIALLTGDRAINSYSISLMGHLPIFFHCPRDRECALYKFLFHLLAWAILLKM